MTPTKTTPMAKGPRKRHPLLTPERIAALSALAKKIDAEEKDEIIARGRVLMEQHEAIVAVITQLKQARVDQVLTVTEVGERSGIGKANVSRLENDPRPNPTWDTLARYAEAVGQRIEMTHSPI